MVYINKILVDPPIVNASCAWASELLQLEELYGSPLTGAVTTRTATLVGFTEDSSHAVRDLVNLTESTLDHSFLGGTRKHVGVDLEFLRLFTSPPFQLHLMDPLHPLPCNQSQTIYNKHHLEFCRRTFTDGRMRSDASSNARGWC